MNPLISRILIFAGIIVVAFVLWRGFLYAPNDEVDSGIAIVDSQTGEPTPAEELPKQIIIPKLDIEADVQRLGVTSNGNMAAPNNFTDVSWYKYGAVPGQKGSAVMAGHVDNALGTPAVFIDLGKLETGDDIFVVREDGVRLHFKVMSQQLYRYDASPVEKIFNDDSGTYLNLITCQGDWVPEAKSAENRLVVFARLVD